MKIWVDADACPVVIKEILFRAAERTGVQVTLLANHPVQVPPLHCIKFIQVSPGFDVADNEIVKRLSAGDLVVTSDIPGGGQRLHTQTRAHKRTHTNTRTQTHTHTPAHARRHHVGMRRTQLVGRRMVWAT